MTSNTESHDTAEGRIIESTTVVERKGWGLLGRRKQTVATSRMVVPPVPKVTVPAAGLLQIAVCPSCGTRNRLPLDHRNRVECGSCRTTMDFVGPAPVVDATAAPPTTPMTCCSSCGARNRLPDGYENRLLRCGKCQREMRCGPTG